MVEVPDHELNRIVGRDPEALRERDQLERISPRRRWHRLPSSSFAQPNGWMVTRRRTRDEAPVTPRGPAVGSSTPRGQAAGGL
jgi:hypothetical protein